MSLSQKSYKTKAFTTYIKYCHDKQKENICRMLPWNLCETLTGLFSGYSNKKRKTVIVENYYVSVFHIDIKNQYHQHTIWAEKVSWSWTKMRAKFIRRHNILYLSNSSCIIILHPKRHLFFFVILVKKRSTHTSASSYHIRTSTKS